jgi:hypothetical protein
MQQATNDEQQMLDQLLAGWRWFITLSGERRSPARAQEASSRSSAEA